MADAAGKTQLGPDHNPPRTRKFLSSFLFKVVMAVLFLVLVPVMTSHLPEFIVGQAVPSRGWEMLNILLVGIAVSYGLFSKRNVVGSDAEAGGKSENAQSYVNRFLQLSSLFDDESDGPCGSDDVGRIQFQSMAWNSQYFRNEPMLVVDEDQNVGDSSGRISDKPLLLPVRSLRFRVLDNPKSDSGESHVLPASLSRSGSMRSRSHDSGVSAASFSRSNSNPGSISKRVLNGGSNTWGDPVESGSNPGLISRRVLNGGSNTWGDPVEFGSNSESISKKVRNGGSSWSRNDGRVSDKGYPESDTNVKDSVVLPSPIPWQSRSGRMIDSREGVDSADTFEIDDLGGSWPQVSQSSLSPKRLSPTSSSSSVSPESKIITDSVKKKSSSHKSRIPVPPPPPPPPPPLAATFKLPTEKPRSVLPVNGNDSSFEYRSHPKSVRTIRASTETVQNKVDFVENFFNGVLEKEEQRHEFFEKMIIESEDEETENDDDDDDDNDSDDDMAADEDHTGVPRDNEEVVSVVSHSIGDGGPDVNKKADEFIAKFREQIRLQRIESIKRSSAEIRKNSGR